MGTSASEIFDLRNFYYYKCGNIFSGSLNNFNYKIIPKENELTVLIWHGMLCSELAEIEIEKNFPLDGVYGKSTNIEQYIQEIKNKYKNNRLCLKVHKRLFLIIQYFHLTIR